MRLWSSKKPNFTVDTPLYPQKIGVWAAILRRRIVRPYFFEGTLIAERYREEILRPFFAELNDDELRFGFFNRRIISRNTPIPYPARSCDLTPCDFFLWPYLKNCIFQQPIHELNGLQHGILEKLMKSITIPTYY